MPNQHALIREPYVKIFLQAEIDKVIFIIVFRRQHEPVIFLDCIKDKRRIRDFEAARFQPTQAITFEGRQIRRRARRRIISILRAIVRTGIHQVPLARRIAGLLAGIIHVHVVMVLEPEHMAKLMAEGADAVQSSRVPVDHVRLAVNFGRAGITVHGHVASEAFRHIVGMRPNGVSHIRIRGTDPSINHIDKINNLIIITIIRRKIHISSDKRIHRFANGVDRTCGNVVRVYIRAIIITFFLESYRACHIKSRAILSH